MFTSKSTLLLDTFVVSQTSERQIERKGAPFAGCFPSERYSPFASRDASFFPPSSSEIAAATVVTQNNNKKFTKQSTLGTGPNTN